MVLLALMQLPGIGRKSLNQHVFLDGSEKCTADILQAILTKARIKSSRIKEYSSEDIKLAIDQAYEIGEACKQYDIHIVTKYDALYPSRFHVSDDPPIILYYKGDISILEKARTIAVVGTREPTEYGYRIGIRVGEILANAGVIVVSGLAVGCDTSGHQGALNGKGLTVAILANGLDTIYPASNKQLAEEILSGGGCLISEYPPHAALQRGFFVDRDRLQACLSDALFVIETDVTGGTMHTVEFARKYKRKIYCFRHPEKYQHEPKVQGNLKMMETGIAAGVYSKADIQTMLDEVAAANTTGTDAVHSADSYQISFFDME